MENRSVLIIDDDDCMAIVMLYVLKRFGYSVTIEYNPIVGLDRAISENPDVILLNYIMPRMDGEQVLRELVNRGISSKVIIETKLCDLNFAMWMIQNGACDYLMYPLDDWSQLITSVKKAVQIKELEDSIKSNNEKISLSGEEADSLQVENEKLKNQIRAIIDENCRLIKKQAEMMEKHFIAQYYGES
jgi:two-component system, OmpR family, alkaline phosphatase synthesis response regulator PhoP